MIDNNLLDTKFIDTISNVEKDIYPKMETYLSQIKIQYDYLKDLAIRNQWNVNNKYDYNDGDYYIYLSEYNNLVIEDQNIYYEFFVKDNKLKVIGYDINQFRNPFAKDNNNSTEITLLAENNKIQKADSIMLECLIMDMYFATKCLKDDQYPEIKYPIDINSIEYQKDFWYASGHNKIDALIKIFMTSTYNDKTEKMEFNGKLYLVYQDITNATPKNYTGTNIPLFYFDQLEDNLKRIKDLLPEYKNALIELYKELKSEPNFADISLYPDYKKLYNQFNLESEEKCENKRQEIYKSLEKWISKYTNDKKNQLSYKNE